MSSARRLVVCDDEEDFCFFVRKVAEGMGYEVREIVQSSGCCDAISEFAPDVVVRDIVMPAPDGIEVVQRLAQAGFGRRERPQSSDFGKAASSREAADCTELGDRRPGISLDSLRPRREESDSQRSGG